MADTKTAVVTVEGIHRDNDKSLGFSGSGGRWNLRKKDHPNWGDIRIGKTLAIEYHTEPFEMNGRTADMKWVDHFEPVDQSQPTLTPAGHAAPASSGASPSIEKQTIVKALAPLFLKPEGGLQVDAFIEAVNKVYLGVFADPLGAAMAKAKEVLGGEFEDEADEFAGTF
jgi:hypothetical protein